MSHKETLTKLPAGTIPAPYQRAFTSDNMLAAIQKKPHQNVRVYADILGCSRSTALNLINSLIREGKIEKKIREVGASKKVFVSYTTTEAKHGAD